MSNVNPNPSQGGLPQGTGSPNAVIQDCPLKKKKATLTATIDRADGKFLTKQAKVKLTGPTGSEMTSERDSADFINLEPGNYRISVTFEKDSDEEKNCAFLPVNNEDYDKQTIVLEEGDAVFMAVKISPINLVKPGIKMEYKTVLLDRKLSLHQEAAEEKIFADPTCIALFLDQSYKQNPYEKGGKLKCTPANVEIYTDKECKKKLAGDLAAGVTLTNKQLTDAEEQKFYLRGKTAGKYEISLELEDPANKLIKKGEPAKEPMGVVQLQMKLHQQNIADLQAIEVDPDTDPVDTYYTNLKNKQLPEQKVMSDEDVIKVGRLLHVQKDKNFGRAKLLLKKMTEAEWPAGCDDYEITINEKNVSGSLEIYDAEAEGVKKDLPLKIKYSDLKTEDKTFWVEGKTTTSKWREAKLDVGLDRADDPPSGAAEKKPGDEVVIVKEAKRNGDWSRFTVAEIDEVKVTTTTAPWNEGEEKFYVNLSTGPDARKVSLSARVKDRLKDVTIHFMLAPDENNRKESNWGKDMPTTWKWKDIDAALKHKDKSDRKKLLHLFAKTDENGVAKIDVHLSRFGGDKFQPAAYLEEDPHLAKYVHGHTDLEKRKPVFAAKTITVWRKFWYQMTYAEGFNPPSPAAARSAYEVLKAQVEAANPHQFPKAGAPANTFYPEWMIKPGGGDEDVAVIGNHNKAAIYAYFNPEAAQPAKAHLVICRHQWDPEGATGTKTVEISSSPSDWITMSKNIIRPPLNGGDVLIQGTWETLPGVDPALNGVLSDGDILIEKPRTGKNKIKVKLPVGAPTPTSTQKIKVKLRLKGAGNYLGESSGNGQIMVVYDPNDVPDYNDTIAHEIAHSLEQTQKVVKETIPAHPNWDDLGQGVHCLKTKCIMYKSGPQDDGSHLFCEDCHPYLNVKDMSVLK